MDLDLNITFGAIAPYMSDPTIEEIWINSPERIFIARAGKSELTNLLLTADEVRNIVERALMWGGRRLDLSHPFVDARLPDGSRLHVAIPEITAQHWAVNIRKHLMRNMSVVDLITLGVMSPLIGTALINSVRAGLNILVSGGTQAGKTTLLNALAGAIPRNERLVTIEEVFELSPQLPDVVSHKFIAPTVASAIDLIVHVSLDSQGIRRVKEVASLTGRYENDRAEIETLWQWNGTEYERGIGSLPHPEKFAAIGLPLTTWCRP
ncbi:MAG: CpaF family protein [Actinobacteria bacterium]|nr:CpaF family protein [Actinomycetota bacterium]